jgi:hypothetical protein
MAKPAETFCNKYLRSSEILCNVERCSFTDVSGQHLGPIFQGQDVRTSWPLKMGPIRCPETSVQDYHLTLRNISEEHISHQHRGGKQKSQIL